MSRRLIGSITSVTPSSIRRSAARLRLATYAARPSRRSRQEFALAPGQGGHATLALGPVPRRQVEERLGQAVSLQPRCDLLGGKVVRKQIFDAGETALRRRRETVEK